MQDDDFSYEPPAGFDDGDGSQGRKIPTWVWIVGGGGLLLLCCVVVGCSLLIFSGDIFGSAFEEIFATLEAEGVDFGTPEPPTTSEESSESSGSGSTTFGGPSTSIDWLYIAEFERSGGWADGEVMGENGEIEAEGSITGGVYELVAVVGNGIYWTNPSERFDDGTYEVEAAAVAGPLDNGYGLMFFYDEETEDFYLFEISSDGWVWIGYCGSGCETPDPLVGDGWFESNLVRQGLNVTNRLTLEVDAGQMRFLINDSEVATAFDTRLTSGDMGLLVESFDDGNVRVHFDNAAYAPLP